MQFVKAHGLGNDFVIINNEQEKINENDMPEISKKLSNRRYGIGCDQILFYDKNSVLFFNADGSSAKSCGNGVRCLAKIIMDKGNLVETTIKTPASDVFCKYTNDGKISVKMPVPKWDLNVGIKTRHEIFINDPVFVDIGNYHLVCFVKDLEYINDLGSILSRHHIDGNNVEFISVVSESEIILKVWERGTGITPACGSGACASVVGAIKRGLLPDIKSTIKVKQDGGELLITYPEMLMIGDANIVFEGNIYI